MECCDSVPIDGAAGPHTQQPPGLCRTLAPGPFLLASDQAIHRSTATKQGGLVGCTEEEGLGKRYEERMGENLVDECSTREMIEDKGLREKRDVEEEDDDVKPLGKILYQNDGSAYVTETESQLPCGVPSSSLGAPTSIISTCYISTSQSPAPHVFCVFHMPHLDKSERLALMTRQSKENAPDVAGLSETEMTRSNVTKPVVMCFPCRLSFGSSHLFRAHALRQHNITFSDEELHLLSFKHTSAILQHVGPGNPPLLCFLEPKRNCESVVPLCLAPPTSGNNVEDTARRKENEDAETSKASFPLLHSPPRTSPATSVPSPAKDASTMGREAEQRGKEDEIWNNGESSDGGEKRMCLEVGRTVENSADSISSSSRQEHNTEAALSNQSISEPPNSATIATSFMNNTKTLTDSETECGTSFNCHDPAPASLVVVNPPTVNTTEQLANQESATATEPNDPSENGNAVRMEPTTRLSDDDRPPVTDLLNDHRHSTPPTLSPTPLQSSQSVLEEGHSDLASRGRLVVAGDGGFVAVGDDVQGSYAYSVQASMAHASMAHTRNSCKTLKCPKCNWHYKYQQTLEAHMKEKHPDTESGQCTYCISGQSHPRLARGETYSCGYKPFRCEVCQYSTTTKGNLSIHMQSDKHLNNMQSLQTQSHTHTPVAQPSPLTHSHPTIAHPSQASSPSPSKLRGRASWRCEVCDYETNVARNLRIHMTSEKHTHNVLLLQQNLAHMQRQRKHNATDLYRHCQPQTKLPDSDSLLSSNDTVTDSAQKLFECILCECFSCDTLEELSQHLIVQRSLPNTYWRSTTGDTHHCRLCHYATPLRANFQLHCQTDKHIQRYQLAAHLQEASSHHGNLDEEEWRLRCVAAGNQAQLRCNACDYEASSLEKLKLHTMNSRHEASIRLYKYLQKLDGVEAEGVWLHCALCDFSTRNSISLVQHSHSLSHQRGEGLLRIQQIQNGLQDEEELGGIFTIRKSPAQENGEHKGMDSPTEVTPNKEDRPGKKSEGFIQTEVEKSESSLTPKRPSSGAGESDETSSCKRPRVQEGMRQCPFCRFCHTDLERLRSHVINQHAVQPALRCPLCQDTLHSVALLRTHLAHLHSVTADCTQKLISTVIASDVLPEKMFLPVQNSDTDQTMSGLNANETKRLDEISTDAEPERGSTPQETSKIHKPPSDDAESTKENSAAFPCWQKGCNKVFTSSSALQTHFNQLHSQKSPTAISDRHIYKYRCNQCSLAFKTPEKLQQHSQYHAIRAATMCCLCQRSFRTLQALRKHLETNHTELSETQIQQLYGGLLMNGESLFSRDQAFGDEEESPDETLKYDEECELEEKPSPTDHDFGLSKDNSECDLKQPVIPLRKGPNITMEKFLDPSRPFKCTVCKESFTQKNILLVHYNSVSHLHKLKRSLQDTTAGVLEPVNSTDHKPFKCAICNVAYSQSSTLEIHMRSVLHQTKARSSKIDSSSSGSESASPHPGKALSSTPATLKPVTNNAGPNHKQNIEHNGAPESNDTSKPSTSEVRNKLVDTLDSATKQQQISLQQQQQLAQAQAHLQQELQKNAALLQSHLFNPALLHSFPMAAEALLSVQQQQQFLLPFLIPGGEFHMNPELSLKSSGLNISTLRPTVNEDTESSKMNDQTPSKGIAENPDIRPESNEQKLYNDSQCEKDTIGQNNKEKSKEADDLNTNVKTELKEGGKEFSGNAKASSDFLQPRIAHDAPGNASRAMLENIGFELVMQFNENKPRYQKNLSETLANGVGEISIANEVENSENTKKLACESCSKLFSNVLILKSHKEQIHGSIFPIKSLEKFAKDYRKQYDKLFPLRPTTTDASPVSSPSPSPPAPPTSVQQTQQPPVQPIISGSTHSSSPATVSIPQIKAPLAPIPLPMELPLFPPLLMPPLPLQGLSPQVPVHLPPVEAGQTPDLTQLYQQQLTAAMLQHQNKRPRTRITDDQLRVLRQYFDINNSPNEDQIHEMADKSGLPHKVIKHWFRNTLFKERQRNKDSPYNFSNPPITTLEDLDMDSKPPSPDPPRQECYGGRRSSRTRFTDYQLRVLQDFFDANAYPKDDEFEQLSYLLNLSTRVIVVWFQNARQKARKNYENQGEDAKDSEHRDLSNDRYFRNSNSSYECKKCSMVFQRIIDLINHQKKHCYKDEDEEMQDDLNETMSDSKIECHSPTSGPSSLTQASTSSSPSSSSVSNTNVKTTDSEHSQTNNSTGELKQTSEASSDLKLAASEDLKCNLQKLETNCEEKLNASTEIHTPSPPKQEKLSCTSQTSPVQSQTSQKMFSPLEISSSEQQQQKPPQEISPYHCIQCKLSFPSFEHWQEHQPMHFLTQSYFPNPQFMDRPVDMPLMLFDPTNPLLARHLLSGTIPHMAVNSPAMTTITDSTINSLKRKLEEKAGSSSMENDWENNGDEPQRDKRMRTTITPEQLEVLYQKYLLDSNPTRKMLDHISNEVGLKKRVVQVWFQNTRARERKGQFRALGPTQIHRRCPFCRALFKAQTALAAHIRSRHWHEARNTGFGLAMSRMTQDQESSYINADSFDFGNYSQFSNTLDHPDSPMSKSMDKSSHQQRLSPKSLKSEGIGDFENPSMSVCKTFEQSKLNKCEPNANMTHDLSIDEGNYSLDGKHGSVDQMSPNTEREVSSENDEKMSSGIVSPAISFNAKDFDNDLVFDYSENSSLADPASPCPGSSNSYDNCQKRHRTQMTNLQVKVLKACFSDYKTPTMLECEALGNDIGLPKRVVQVWFQNARAKGKKAKLSLAKQFGTESTSIDRPKPECTLCSVKYSGRFSVRDHVFSQQHLAKVKEALGGQMERDKEYFSSVSTRQLMPQQEVDQMKKASDILGLNQTGLQGQSSVYSIPASIPGGSNTMATIKTGASEPPVNEVTRKPASKSSSAISAMDDKDVVSTTNSVLTPKTTQQDLELQFPKENDTESKKIPTNKLDTTHQSNSSSCKEKPDSSRPEKSVSNTAREYAMDPSQLQALHAAMKSEQAALLPSPLLPYMMPGFSPIFSPHIPTPMNSGLMQPMFGIESMFSYGPVLPQALMGLSPSSLLQQYQQNLQGALMQQRLQLQQLQQTEKPKSSQISARLHADKTRGPVLDSTKRDKKQSSPNGTHSPSVNTKQQQLDDSVLQSHCIFSKAACGGEGRDGQLYDCLACEVSFTGDAGLTMHLENPQHRQRVAESLNSKEHASPELPHVSPSSTSQPDPPGELRSSSTAPSVLPSGTSDQCTSDTRRPQSSSSISALPETTQSSTASLSYHILSPSSVTSSLTSLAKTCHMKPADGCCNES
ncbi:Zinc finger homeobox protein 3 AT motif-binding factor 1 AT-binding transcription factor 1 [Triplophysa tibetana]|uniref:Zinc finger homeobox protein 3 AT motif-binding factor 1 AT-binding transcription factor 1 n=1 Tax=Triplophysa tibetana TaxID=1572043 RepID=A0A5A9NYD0_9TELE|nr:Zinc finger homeobox protein 3 AT motif-binding factor 1 AT-binding transcription factor 1 [Triplophysa tibetana]